MPNEQPFSSDAATHPDSHAGCTAHAANDLETAATGVDTTEANRRPLKGGVGEWYQSEWSIGYMNVLKISVVVQRSPIPPLRGARGM